MNRLDFTVAPRAELPGAALRRVLEHIDANVHRGPQLDELGRLVHMSTFHFARLFKASTGLPPHRFVVMRRIEHAKQMLACADISIAAIGRVVGFRTASHFTSAFRRVAGVTPSAYRTALAAEPAPEPLTPERTA
jgi:AraC family transcriptional regulator